MPRGEVRIDVWCFQIFAYEQAERRTATKNRTVRQWTSDDDDMLLGLKSSGHTWQQITTFMEIPSTTCKERYNKLMKMSIVWNKELDIKVRKAYFKHRETMWQSVAREVGVPWRAVEDRAWDLGKKSLVIK